MNLYPLTDTELLIAAGLFTSTRTHNEMFYYRWMSYAKELRRRKLAWDKARSVAKVMRAKTLYPKRGWEKRYVKHYGEPVSIS